MKLWTLLSALILDSAFGDPPNRFHPVVLIGKYFTAGRKRAPRENRFQFGALWTLSGVALFAMPIHAIRRWIRHPMAGAILLKPIFAYRNLRRAVQSVAVALHTDNLPEARRLLAWHLVSRNTDELSAEEVAAAAIESLAENLTDSVAAPLMAFSLGGLPAAWGYRVVNTADAMWGYRSAEFEQLGKFPARLDDALNWFPARLTSWLIVFAASKNFNRAKNTMLTQHARTESPNAGWTMAAMAGALGVTLGKRGVYSLEGGTSPVTPDTIRRALKIADAAVGLLFLSIGLIFLLQTLFGGKNDRRKNTQSPRNEIEGIGDCEHRQRQREKHRRIRGNDPRVGTRNESGRDSVSEKRKRSLRRNSRR